MVNNEKAPNKEPFVNILQLTTIIFSSQLSSQELF